VFFRGVKKGLGGRADFKEIDFLVLKFWFFRLFIRCLHVFDPQIGVFFGIFRLKVGTGRPIKKPALVLASELM
jgi:hypothetical protein